MGEEGEIVPCTNTNEDTELVMDTPKRSKNTQIATSIAKFEESPVFNFLNNLSPIKPVKSMHISQTINPLSFTTLPAVFASPHVTSLRESRFLRRNQLSDPSKPEFSTDDGTTVDKGSETTRQLDEHKENQDPKANNVENFSENGVEFRESLNYGCNSPKSSLRSSSCLTSQHRADYACSSSRFVPFREEGTQRGIYVSESNQERITQFDSNKDSCDWESLISDASDLLVFESPNDYKKPIDPGTGLCEQHDMQNNVDAFAPGEQIIGEGSETENVSTQPGDGSEMMENFETNDMVDGSLSTNPSEKMDSENLSGLYRGMRRRCLVFDMSGAKRKHFDDNGGSVSTQDEELVCDKTGKDYSLGCVLPGIGLHLNALATTPKDYKIVNHEASASGRLLISPTPSSSVKIQPQTTNQDFSNNNMAMVAFSEAELDTFENHVPPMEDQISGYAANEEEINQSGSPKKKKRRLEQGVEGESSCKRCNCKKSKCLKLYCECFAAGVYCVEPCACIDCFNKPIHEETVLATRKQIESRNPLAFAPKVVRGPDSLSETRDDSSKTPASARHKRGCNCKKSGCLKKYCECYQGGVGCSINCRCEGCKNAFGRKDGTCMIGTELEFLDDETSTENGLNQNTDSLPPATPLRAVRQSVENPFSSKRKPPRSSFPSVYGKQSSFQPPLPPPPKFMEHFETIGEDEIPEFLQCGSPISGGSMKLSSPNQKRVLSPRGVGKSPGGLMSSRKLILQSIPSFPSLTPNQ